MTERNHFVYRAYDSVGRILYVGCTGKPNQRYANHRATSAWFPYATSIKMAGPYEKADAYSREKNLILELRPLFNALPEHALMGRRRAKRLREVQDSLLAQMGVGTPEEHFDLLVKEPERLQPVWEASEAIVDHEFDLRCYHLGRIRYYERLIASEQVAS